MGRRKPCLMPVGVSTSDVAQGIQEPNAGYGSESAAWSPSLSPGLQQVGRITTATQQQSPQNTSQGTPPPFVPRPPDPSVGGQVGRSEALGWTTGLLPSRTFRQPFTGRTLVRPNMGANPAVGPVGLSNRTGRLASGVAALVDTWLPPAQVVRESFVQPQTAPRNRNPLMGAT